MQRPTTRRGLPPTADAAAPAPPAAWPPPSSSSSSSSTAAAAAAAHQSTSAGVAAAAAAAALQQLRSAAARPSPATAWAAAAAAASSSDDEQRSTTCCSIPGSSAASLLSMEAATSSIDVSGACAVAPAAASVLLSSAGGSSMSISVAGSLGDVELVFSEQQLDDAAVELPSLERHLQQQYTAVAAASRCPSSATSAYSMDGFEEAAEDEVMTMTTAAPVEESEEPEQQQQQQQPAAPLLHQAPDVWEELEQLHSTLQRVAPHASSSSGSSSDRRSSSSNAASSASLRRSGRSSARSSASARHHHHMPEPQASAAPLSSLASSANVARGGLTPVAPPPPPPAALDMQGAAAPQLSAQLVALAQHDKAPQALATAPVARAAKPRRRRQRTAGTTTSRSKPANQQASPPPAGRVRPAASAAAAHNLARRSVGLQVTGTEDKAVQAAPPCQPRDTCPNVQPPALDSLRAPAEQPARQQLRSGGSTWGLLAGSLRAATLLDELERLLRAAEHQQQLHQQQQAAVLGSLLAPAALPRGQPLAVGLGAVGAGAQPLLRQPLTECQECRHRQQMQQHHHPAPPLPACPEPQQQPGVADALDGLPASSSATQGAPVSPACQPQAGVTAGSSSSQHSPPSLQPVQAASTGWISVPVSGPALDAHGPPPPGALPAAAAPAAAPLPQAAAALDNQTQAADGSTSEPADSGWFSIALPPPPPSPSPPAAATADDDDGQPPPDLADSADAPQSAPEAATQQQPHPEPAIAFTVAGSASAACPAPAPAPGGSTSAQPDTPGCLVHDAMPAQQAVPIAAELIPHPRQQCVAPQQQQQPGQRYSSVGTLKRYAMFLTTTANSGSSSSSGRPALGLTARDAATLQHHLAHVTAARPPAGLQQPEGPSAAALNFRIQALQQVHAALVGGALQLAGSGSTQAAAGGGAGSLLASNKAMVARALQLQGLHAGLTRAKSMVASLRRDQQQLMQPAVSSQQLASHIATASKALPHSGSSAARARAPQSEAAAAAAADCYSSLEATLERIRQHRASRRQQGVKARLV